MTDAESLRHEGSETAGVVLSSTGRWVQVQLADRVVRATIRGKFRLREDRTTNPLAVGDRVRLQLLGDDAVITHIEPRENQLSRRAAGRRVGMEHILVANVDFAWAVQSVGVPRLNPGFVDRFLVMAEYHDIPAGVLVNKIDLIDDPHQWELTEFVERFEAAGYPVLLTSAATGAGLPALSDRLDEATTVFCGPSGVGKSSLINALDASVQAVTGHVSERTRKGRHVTTHARLYLVNGRARIVDTPGLREFGVIDVEPSELGYHFPEFRPHLQDCRYPDCTHDHEPDCAIREAVEAGTVAESRWRSYLNILDSLNEGEKDVGR